MTSALERFLPLLVAGDTPASEKDLTPDAVIFDVISGPVPPAVLPFFLPGRYLWLSMREARLEPRRTIRSETRIVVEQVLHLTVEGKAIELPVALASEPRSDGTLRQVRVYHSMLPLTGHRNLRTRLMDRDESVTFAAPVDAYQDALRRGDVDAIASTFADPESVRPHYQGLLARGGIVLEHCTVTDDGAACAVEYNALRWGDRDVPPQPGLAVFERAGPRTLAAARIYDDVTPPSG